MELIIEEVDINKIKESSTGVWFIDKQSYTYKSLVKSIKKYGLFEPILVRPKQNNYEIVDGLSRYEAAKEIGLIVLAVIIRNLNDEDVREIREIHSKKYIKVTSEEYVKQLKRLVKMHPELSLSAIAKKINKSEYCLQLALNTPSSNGRTTAFGAVNPGSNPGGVTIVHDWKIELKDKWDDEVFMKCVLGDVHLENKWDFQWDDAHWDYETDIGTGMPMDQLADW